MNCHSSRHDLSLLKEDFSKMILTVFRKDLIYQSVLQQI